MSLFVYLPLSLRPYHPVMPVGRSVGRSVSLNVCLSDSLFCISVGMCQSVCLSFCLLMEKVETVVGWCEAQIRAALHAHHFRCAFAPWQVAAAFLLGEDRPVSSVVCPHSFLWKRGTAPRAFFALMALSMSRDGRPLFVPLSLFPWRVKQCATFILNCSKGCFLRDKPLASASRLYISQDCTTSISK